MNEDHDMIPVRDPYSTKKMNHEDTAAYRANQQRQMVNKWSREDLEDKYLRIYEENQVLKRHGRKQEEKIKKMATKLIRLVSDKKKIEQTGGVKKMRDIETEEMMEELHGKIRELDKQNHQLKERLIVTKQQLATQGSRKTPYTHVQSRIDTGITRASPQDTRLVKSMRVSGPPTKRAHSPTMPRYGHSLLEETRAENRQLEGTISQLHEQLNIYEQDIEMLKEQMRIRETEYEEDLLKIKQQMSQGQRTAIQENIDIIRLQRDVKEKSTRLVHLQGQFSSLEENLRRVRSSHEQVLLEMEGLQSQLKAKDREILNMNNQLKEGTASRRTILELQERTKDMENECEILKKANEELVSSAFDLEREREWRQRENALKIQIAQLEATLKADVGEKGTILDRLSSEKETLETLEEEHRDMRQKYYQLKHENDELTDKMRFFTKESAVDFQEIEEALMIVKQRKERENPELDFLHKVDDEKNADYERLVRELQAEHADTINELDKTRNMLVIQHKINKDYQTEVVSVTNKMEEERKETEDRLQEYAQLLDLRAARIRKLEAQLRDVAYGTRQYRLPTGDGVDEEEASDIEDVDETIHMERGQNLFEIHIKKVEMSQEALRVLGDSEPSIFCTWEFYEYEIQSTPIQKGPMAEFSFTSQYLVQVDDFFLHYLNKDSCTVELHQSFGTDYQTVGACQLRMRDILDKTRGKLYGTVQFTGMTDNGHGSNLGSLEYWVRWRVPMEQALRLYKERSKALGYLHTNVQSTEQALAAMDDQAARRPADNVNVLHITLKHCSNLEGRSGDMQPSTYCIYKFFDFNDHDTVIVESSNNPHFSDHQAFPVPMTADLDKYLKAQQLLVYVFDDTDPEDAAYLGLAKIPLLPLAHDKGISGIFELHRVNGSVNGDMTVELKWTHAYLPPRHATHTAAQLEAAPQETPERLALLPGEEMALQDSIVVAAAPATSYAPQPPRLRNPQAQSTPLPNRNRKGKRGQMSTSADDTDDSLITPVKEDTDQEGSIVSEGTPVPGESEPVTEDETEPMGIETDVSSSLKHLPSAQVPQEKPSGLFPGEEFTDDESVSSTHAQRVGVVAKSNKAAILQESGNKKPNHISNSQKPTVHAPLPPPRTSLQQCPSAVRGGLKFLKTHAKYRVRVDESVDDLVAAEMDEESEDEEEIDRENEDDNTLSNSPEHVGKEGLNYDSNDSDDVEGVSDEELPPDAPSEADTEESDGVVLASPHSRPQSKLADQGDTVVVGIHNFHLNEHATVHQNDAAKMLFVEYRLLGVSSEETETPYSLPKPPPGKQVSFNFVKTFAVDYENNYERRQYLASMLLPNDPDEGRIRFTVVNEPEEDSGDDCEDVGVATVSVQQILNDQRDVVEEDIAIYDVDDSDLVIGQLNITVKCFDAMKAVKTEMALPEEFD